MRMTGAGVFAVLFMACLGVASAAATLPPRDELGRQVKMSVLVDKVMQPVAGWTTKEWMIKEAAAAGFNVFSPRAGFDDLKAVRQVSEWCAKYGMYHMPWMRGSLTAPAGAAADGKRLVWANGAEQPLWSPNSDEFWAWTTRYIVAYAKISATEPALMGVFLDYENYAPGKQGNLYSLSYDDVIMNKFAQAKGLRLPALAPAQRRPWLAKQKLSDEFRKFQIDYWRQRCRALREAVDRYNPKFQFCIYPAPGTLFMVQACYPEWATKAAPIILADPWTYGRSGKYMSQAAGLKENHNILERDVPVAKNSGVPYIYIGGIDPVVHGADPEFCGKNAVMISQFTDGYWVFYEGPKYKTTHKDYFKWFTWANKAIAAGNFKAWQEPRETPDPSALPKFHFQVGSVAAPDAAWKLTTYPLVKMRGGSMVLVAGRKGQPVNLTVQHYPIGKSNADIEYEVQNADWDSIKKGTIAAGTRGVISFTPPTTGLYPLMMTAGGCAYSIISANAPVALYARDGLSVIYGAQRLYFYVPAGLDKFTLKAHGQGVETAKLTVYGPDGKQVASAQTTPKKTMVEFTVPVGDQGGKTWSLSDTKGDQGVIEDSTIWLDPKLPPTLSLTPSQVLKLK